MQWYNESATKALETLRSTPEGLTPEEAARRLAETGANKLTQAQGPGLVQRFLKQLADPMVIILIVAAAISAVTALLEGESLADVFIILAVVLINAVLGVYQENKAEKAIEALQNMMAPTSKVIRAGELLHLPSEALVPGDVLALEAGDAVPADARILESASLQVEEAALTGESVPVYKQEEALPAGAEPPLGDRKNMLYMGGTVVYGRGRAVVTATGMQTEMGKIAGALALAEDQQTPLQKRLHQLSRVLTFVVIGICAFIFAFSLLRSGDFSGEMLMDTFLIA
ncbi:MAG: HAD-IC family P-type ATPase, partial [Oscillospiraceae bacterium]|nr:HAD-IC family P-type ATPase [Oscillospiraceae bacterium]